ncbi:entericidin A/B family lipoprotein [Imbroritus primus]
MKRFFLSLLTLAVLAGCNTMAGLGRDTQAAGQKLENAAKR